MYEFCYSFCFILDRRKLAYSKAYVKSASLNRGGDIIIFTVISELQAIHQIDQGNLNLYSEFELIWP